MSGNFFSGQFYSSGFFGAAVTVDTHDGGWDGKKRKPSIDTSKAEARNALRAMLAEAFDPDIAPNAITELAAPVVERMESGRIRIDWDALSRDVKREITLTVMAQERERIAYEMEQDDEDILLLLQ